MSPLGQKRRFAERRRSSGFGRKADQQAEKTDVSARTFDVGGSSRRADPTRRSTIGATYHEDETFRKYVSRYVDHFEKLLAEANESDPENLLSSTFLSADVGKLYLLLARSVGRLN